jgi:hypothetical protein
MWSATIAITSACTHKTGQPRMAATLPSDDSYTDLASGEQLRIVVPLLKSGGYRSRADSELRTGATIILSAGDLIGYEVFHYSVRAQRQGRVALRFNSAEITKEEKTVPDLNTPTLPFVLPSKPQHVRLIYFIRNSRSDHNMAIAGAKDLTALDAFTNRLKVDPSVCNREGEVFCAWIPAGIAVRPEGSASSK